MSALVTYSSSSEPSDGEDVEDENVMPRAKKPRSEGDLGSRDRLPLPKDVLSMFCEEEEALNDEDDKKHLHMGRTRTFAHVPGNWSTYLYVPFDCDSRFIRCIELLRDYLTNCYPVTAGHAEFHVIPACDLHVTVSRTVAIRHHWIEPLMSKLRNGLCKHKSFRYQLSELEVYCNDAKTRCDTAHSVHIMHDF